MRRVSTQSDVTSGRLSIAAGGFTCFIEGSRRTRPSGLRTGGIRRTCITDAHIRLSRLAGAAGRIARRIPRGPPSRSLDSASQGLASVTLSNVGLSQEPGREGMRPPHVLFIVGARPNFMKVAPVYRALDEQPRPIDATLLHTGQHYDAAMSDVFFADLELPAPDVHLHVGSGSHAHQTARALEGIAEVLERDVPGPTRRRRRREFHTRRGTRCGEDERSRSRTSSPGFAVATGPCPRSTTGA